jgi:hypothetical protein
VHFARLPHLFARPLTGPFNSASDSDHKPQVFVLRRGTACIMPLWQPKSIRFEVTFSGGICAGCDCMVSAEELSELIGAVQISRTSFLRGAERLHHNKPSIEIAQMIPTSGTAQKAQQHKRRSCIYGLRRILSTSAMPSGLL